MLGRLLALDMKVKDGTILEDIQKVRFKIADVIKGKLSVVSFDCHDFGPNFGVTAIWLLEESHLAVHTWPEKSMICIDIFTCGETDPWDLVEDFKKQFECVDFKIHFSKRGIVSSLYLPES